MFREMLGTPVLQTSTFVKLWADAWVALL